MGNTGGNDATQSSANSSGEDDRDLKIEDSETSSDSEVGHTPGKAEGVSEPEDQGNQ